MKTPLRFQVTEYDCGTVSLYNAISYLFDREEIPAKLLKTISVIQREFPEDEVPIRTALVTARNAPAHERVIRTLRAWDIRIDEAFFLGGIQKSEVLKAFGAHIFFDDQSVHTEPASRVVPAARVPYKQGE